MLPKLTPSRFLFRRLTWPRLADLHVDPTRDIFARAAEIVLLTREALVEAGELVTQPEQGLPRIVHFGDLRRESLPQPVSDGQPQLEVRIGERRVWRYPEAIEVR